MPAKITLLKIFLCSRRFKIFSTSRKLSFLLISKRVYFWKHLNYHFQLKVSESIVSWILTERKRFQTFSLLIDFISIKNDA